MKICYFGTYRHDYSRNVILMKGLRNEGNEVIECHEILWGSIEDRIKISTGGWTSVNFIIKIIKVYFSLALKFFKLKNVDIIVIGYPGQLDVIIAKFLCIFKRKPICWDILMSVYQAAIERKLHKRNAFSVWLIGLSERIAGHLADLLILDTSEYINWFSNRYKINPSKFKVVPLGADDRLFYPINRQEKVPKNNSLISVLYFGSFIPNHGINIILDAAKELLDNPNIQFTLIGTGPEKEMAVIRTNQENLTNINFLGWVSDTELLHNIQNADICLGVFGNTENSKMTVQNKLYECLAMGKPLISGESNVVRQNFNDKEEIYLCKRDGKSLAEAIRELASNPMRRTLLGIAGQKAFIDRFSVEKIGKIFSDHLLNFFSTTSR